MDTWSFSGWWHTVWTGVGHALHRTLVGVPNVLAGLVVFLVGVILGVVLKELVVRVLKSIQLKPVAKQSGWYMVFPGGNDVVELLGDFVKWFVIVVFLVQALTIVHVAGVADAAVAVVHLVPVVFAGAFVLFVGLVVAGLAGRLVTATAHAMGAASAGWLGKATTYTIVAVVGVRTLRTLGVSSLYLDRLFIAVVVIVGLAGGLAFGLGARDLARDTLDGVKLRFKK